MKLLTQAIKHVLLNPAAYSRHVLGMALRPYQEEIIQAIVEDVLERRGSIITVHMARQMGKNETSAHLEAYLLTLFQRREARMVKAAPTYKPQTLNSLMRLQSRLDNHWTQGQARTRHGYMVQLGQAMIAFLSGEPNANVVGHTANLLLEIDEAQDFLADRYDRAFRPMASTGNATTVMYGTAWTSDTLLAQQIETNKTLEAHDGRRRHFEYPWHVLAEVSPAYRQFVETERDRLGEDHPVFLTQYALRTIDTLMRLLPPAAINLMRAPRTVPAAITVAGLDPAGEGPPTQAGQHDRTVLLLASCDPNPAGPSVSVYEARYWQGERHTVTIPEIIALLEAHDVRAVAVDATGLGETYASAIEDARPGTVMALKYSRPVKSTLAVRLRAAANTGRLHVALPDHHDVAPILWQECEHALLQVLPGGLFGFYVPESQGHDDTVNALALAVYAATETKAHPHAATIISPQPQEDTF